jgi:acyl-CoA synthetase (AMP-forming)/AMP-acid ligase II
MHPGENASKFPDKPALILEPSGEQITHGQLDARSNQIAQRLFALGLRPGDGIALYAENHPRYFEICWAAQRSGLYYTAVSSQLTAPEVEYIVKDCGAKVFFTSRAKAAVAAELAAPLAGLLARVMLDEAVPGYEPFDEFVAGQPDTPIAEELQGQDLLYSSGTTGRPKGVKPPLTGRPVATPPALLLLAKGLYGMDEQTIYLSPAPFYHAAPLRFNMAVQRLGGSCVLMEKFDPELALALIEKHRITHSQWVPTHFVRMLKLPEAVRARYDVSSLKAAIHAAAPCPIPVKERMMEWWGPVIYEYYAGTEGNGLTAADPEEWLSHKGTVGKPVYGKLHIVNEETGEEQVPGQPGLIYFSEGGKFQYHNDPEKTASTFNERGWSSLGDVGYVDEKGFLYLTDRKAHMIISGGVNIYPQEVENLLITHPKVADAAVIGVPNEDFGEEVKAVVQLVDPSGAGDEVADELLAFCRANLAHVKCPRSVDFEAELPRHATGKLYKRLLRDRYWGGHASRIV